ncbi:247b621b-a71b-4edf-8479-9138b1a971f7 [Sclerotinia trifoliorum]|uniref:247b621b-a71b-4edf-8479-9138b1a971f7 n=1 Tax=Sclerotinia trifoliorum TaxID=28548 RepID=A0A8H2W1C2_9HELO|nr:247b621b-a71b-4edf-8479-9138b1a971f7 [Sclerotinia trifoliorum]
MAYQYPKDDWPLDEKALGTEFVTVQVGKQKKEVAFHKKLLSSRSTAFEHHMKVLKEKGKYQFHCEPRFENAFSILVTYLYKGYVPSCPIEDGPESSSYGRQMRELYYLAERFEIIDLMDKTMDAIQVHDCRFNRDIHKHMPEVYKNTTRKSSLRFYCALSAAWYFGRPNSSNSQKLNRLEGFKDKADILYDILKIQLRFESSISNATSDYRIPSDESGLGPCAFHTHPPGEMCQRLALLASTKSSHDYKHHQQIHGINIKQSRNVSIGNGMKESMRGSISVSGSSEVMEERDEAGDYEDDLLILRQEKTRQMTKMTHTKKIKEEDGEEQNDTHQSASKIVFGKRLRSPSPILGSTQDDVLITGKRPLESNDGEDLSRKRPFVIIEGSTSQDRRSEPTGPTRGIQQQQQQQQLHAGLGIRRHHNEDLSANIKQRTPILFNHSNGQITPMRNETNHTTSGSIMSNYGRGTDTSRILPGVR